MMEIGPIFRAMKKNRFGVALLVIEVAFTLAIALNCVVIISDQKARINTPTGYEVDDLVMVTLQSFGEGFQETEYFEQVVRDDMDALRAMPGVKNAERISSALLVGGGTASGYRPMGNPDAPPVSAAIYGGGEQLFDTLGLTLDSGRTLTSEDVLRFDPNDPPSCNVMVTRELADALYPDGDALGKQITDGGPNDTIVGIVDYMFTTYNNQPLENRVIIYPSTPGSPDNMNYIIRTEPGKEDAVMSGVVGVLESVNKERIFRLQSQVEIKEGGFAMNLMIANIMTVVIVLLIFITALGILGMSYFSVSRRTRQIGVRRALGATRQDIIRYFLVENALIVLMGAAPGIILAVVMNGFYARSLPNATQLPTGLALGGFLLLWAVAAGATLAPALKAARIEPAEATRVG